MFDEYVSVFDLNLPVILKSFTSANFLFTTSMFGSSKRDFDLFESEFANVLWFDYSYEGHARIFIRIKNPKIEQFNTNTYYPVVSRGESSCGNVISCSCKNPWEKFQKNVRFGRRKDNLYLDKLNYDDNIFFTKCLDENVIKQELQYKYRVVNDDVKSFHSLYQVKNSGQKLLTTYNEFGEYKLNTWSLDVNGKVVEYDIIENTVYRDGGTTYKTMKDPSGVEHLFFSPSPMTQNAAPATFDNEEIEQILDKNIIKDTMTKLNILSLSE